MKNEFVHIYPLETDLKLEAVKEAINELDKIKEIYLKIRNYLNGKNLL